MDKMCQQSKERRRCQLCRRHHLFRFKLSQRVAQIAVGCFGREAAAAEAAATAVVAATSAKSGDGDRTGIAESGNIWRLSSRIVVKQ